MNFDLQPTDLKNELVTLIPLAQSDFEKLYSVASDPLIWEQHPNKNRYQKEAFQTYFKGAIESGGAFIVTDSKTAETIGSSRFTGYDPFKKSVEIGYTFLARDHWGTVYNHALKSIMLDHAFKFVDAVIFHIGANNIRSQKAIEKLGAKKTGEIEMKYYGEQNVLNYTYEIDKDNWAKSKSVLQNP